MLDRFDHGGGEAPFRCQGRAQLGKAVFEDVPFSLRTTEVEHGNAADQVHHGLGHAGMHHQFADALKQPRSEGRSLIDSGRQCERSAVIKLSLLYLFWSTRLRDSTFLSVRISARYLTL